MPEEDVLLPTFGIGLTASHERPPRRTDEVPDAWFGQFIPLEQNGLLRRSERVRSRRWEVYITIGEKP